MATGIDLLAVISCVRRFSSPSVGSLLNSGRVVHLSSVPRTSSPRGVV